MKAARINIFKITIEARQALLASVLRQLIRSILCAYKSAMYTSRSLGETKVADPDPVFHFYADPDIAPHQSDKNLRPPPPTGL